MSFTDRLPGQITHCIISQSHYTVYLLKLQWYISIHNWFCPF